MLFDRLYTFNKKYVIILNMRIHRPESEGGADQPHEDAAQLICSLDSLEVGQSYKFNPPLHVATVSITSKHRLKEGYRHPNFLQNDIRTGGIREGKLISKTGFNEDGVAIGTFACKCRFRNSHTNQTEDVSYTVTSKFSRAGTDGIRVSVQQAVKETMEGADENE